jgi:putative acetyltransferase
VEPASRRKEDIQAIRHFNRYYTNRLGLLGRYRFNTKLSLTEARVIYEIGRRGEHTQSALCAGLKVDMGYLNRVVRRLATAGLLARRKDEQDGRIVRLGLTEAGRKVLEEINAASDEQTEALIAELAEDEANRLVEHFRAAERILEKRSVRRPRIERVEKEAEVNTVRILMREYESFLGADLSFQGFEAELAALPGKYAPPEGALFLALIPDASGGAEPAGCVALRKLAPGICEMKRLFVRPEYRGLGLGRLLAERIVEEGRKLGYRSMRLDTLDRLEGAMALYRSMGFRTTAPYYLNPLPGAMFWEKEL